MTASTRRVLLVLLLTVLPALAVGPALAGAHAVPVAAAKSTPKKAAAKTCHKNGKTVACPAKKKTHKPAKKRPAKHKKATATAIPPAVIKPRSTATATATPSPTPTITATPTATATPLPSDATIPVQAETGSAGKVVFYVCGLPSGVTASFGPNPASATPDPSNSLAFYARSTLTLSADWHVPIDSSYSLQLFAYYEGGAAGGTISPEYIQFSIDAAGYATASSAPVGAWSGQENCSAIPPAYAPTATPTPAAGDVQVSASVSPPLPAAGQAATVTAHITLRGQPLANVPATFTFYGPRVMPNCQTFTDLSGTATCSFANANPLPGAQVLVAVTFYYDSQVYVADAWYTM